MDELETGQGPAARAYEQSTFGYHEFDVLHEFMRDYGHSTVIACLQAMARQAIARGDASELAYADQAAYFARRLKDKDYRKACDLEAGLTAEIAQLGKEIDQASAELRELHARFSFFWYRIKRLVEPRRLHDARPYRIVPVLRIDWGARDTLDIEALLAVIHEFLDDLLQRAEMDPGQSSVHCTWRMVPGAFLEFGERADDIPALRKECDTIAALLGRKHELMTKLGALHWKRVDATKQTSAHFFDMRETIRAVGLGKLAAQLDRPAA
ncbi:MAG: hypothetical protein AB1584_10740 [Pseudomonadota bacterium]